MNKHFLLFIFSVALVSNIYGANQNNQNQSDLLRAFAANRNDDDGDDYYNSYPSMKMNGRDNGQNKIEKDIKNIRNLNISIALERDKLNGYTTSQGNISQEEIEHTKLLLEKLKGARNELINKESNEIVGNLKKINSINENIESLNNKLDDRDASKNKISEEEKDQTLIFIKRLEDARNSLLNPEITTPTEAIRQGVSIGLLGRGCSKNDSMHNIVLQSITEQSTKPLGKVIAKRSTVLWEKAFDKIENGIGSIVQFFGFTPTISINDINRWQANCTDLASTYKELRKGIENSESRATSMQLRSMLTESFDTPEEATEQKQVVDPAWIQRRKGDLILLNFMLEKLTIRLDESTNNNDWDLEASLQRLICDTDGLISQLTTANCLQDLIDSTRTQLMISYFSSIDSGLNELGMIINPEQSSQKSNRKKASGFGGGYNNYGGNSWDD
ncbi:hypothetical protein JKY79_03470 [Candidatus Babeliales bacterium]|nr:hypothetical protein [Candidatus Babeliales bacterium]